jgi:hypothetical protein
MIIDCFKVIK